MTMHPERLAFWSSALSCIIDSKRALLRSQEPMIAVPALAILRWQLAQVFCNYRWFLRSKLACDLGDQSYILHARAINAALDDVHDTLRSYVLYWSCGDNVSRWPDYRTAAGVTLDQIAVAVARTSEQAAAIMQGSVPSGEHPTIRIALPPAVRAAAPVGRDQRSVTAS